MSKTATIRARIDPELKNHVEDVFRHLGMSTTQAITIFYKQVEMRGGLPFDVAIPNAVTKRTFEKTDAGRELIVCENEDEMFDTLNI